MSNELLQRGEAPSMMQKNRFLLKTIEEGLQESREDLLTALPS